MAGYLCMSLRDNVLRRLSLYQRFAVCPYRRLLSTNPPLRQSAFQFSGFPTKFFRIFSFVFVFFAVPKFYFPQNSPTNSWVPTVKILVLLTVRQLSYHNCCPVLVWVVFPQKTLCLEKIDKVSSHAKIESCYFPYRIIRWHRKRAGLMARPALRMVSPHCRCRGTDRGLWSFP